MISTSSADYLKAIYDLGSGETWVSTSALAQRMAVAPSSATSMAQRLADQGLASYVPYQGVKLTGKGREAALEILRHHRLLELYLEQALGYPWDRVHDEAERLEHTISEELEDRIDAALGHPTEDPHGHPIPPKHGAYHEEKVESLWDTRRSGHLLVRRVSDRDPEVLRYLDTVGLRPGVEIEVVGRAPFDGPLTIRTGETDQVLGERLADQIFVAPITAAPHGDPDAAEHPSEARGLTGGRPS
jgi:DtxR family transcriptional regulator, Mn-dependent transcriptional regulator